MWSFQYEFDSRNVIAGSLFVAVNGYKSDGHDFIDSANRFGCNSSPLRKSSEESCWKCLLDKNIR